MRNQAELVQTSMTDFSRTFGRLRAERRGMMLVSMGGAALVFGAWLGWFVWGRVSVYEVSARARIERDAASQPIASSLMGRVVGIHFCLGQRVQSGEVLIELDAVPEQLQLKTEEARVRGLEEQLVRLRAQIDAEQTARGQERQSARLDAREAQDLVREAEIAAHAADKDLVRVRALNNAGLLPERELDRGEAEARMRDVTVARLTLAVEQSPERQTLRERERDVRLERLRGEMAALEAERGTRNSEIGRLGYEIERRRVRAPVDGSIGEAAQLHKGSVVKEGDTLGSIVPDGEVVIVAQYPAEAAFGRIRAGQTGLLRLQGFPWTEFGTVAATVTRVAQEVRDGTVRVECAVGPDSRFRGPLEHGMPGSLEVAVERLSPLALVLGNAGQRLTLGP